MQRIWKEGSNLEKSYQSETLSVRGRLGLARLVATVGVDGRLANMNASIAAHFARF